MSNIYRPDAWVIVEAIYEGTSTKKVFAGWYGGYLGSDSWKLSSGIIEVKEEDEHYHFINESGSVYICHKGIQRMTGYMMRVLSSWQTQAAELLSNSSIEVIPYG